MSMDNGRWIDPKDRRNIKTGLVGLACVISLSMAAGVALGRFRAVPAKIERHALYLVSVSRVAYREADKWLVEYSLDGHAEAVELPIKAGEPDGFLGYLESIK